MTASAPDPLPAPTVRNVMLALQKGPMRVHELMKLFEPTAFAVFAFGLNVMRGSGMISTTGDDAYEQHVSADTVFELSWHGRVALELVVAEQTGAFA